MTKQIENLAKIQKGTGGSVVYVFVEKRLKLNKDTGEQEEYNKLARQQLPIKNDIFLRSNGTKRSLEEVYKVFEDTKRDLGASYFYVVS